MRMGNMHLNQPVFVCLHVSDAFTSLQSCELEAKWFITKQWPAMVVLPCAFRPTLLSCKAEAWSLLLVEVFSFQVA